MAYDNGPVRVAQDHLRAHVDQSVHEEQSAFKHLLVNQDAASALGGYDQHHAQQVRRESRPWSIGYRHYGSVQK